MTNVNIRVAVRIRPLLLTEILHNHQVCVRLVPGSGQVVLGSERFFSFDHAFGPTATQDEVYESCIQPMVKSLIDGYNASVFCYGQTGSGKTYTFGGRNMDHDGGGFIERVAKDIFLMHQEKCDEGDGVESSVQVSYMELYKEELRDLLELHTVQKVLHIREDERGNTVVVGAKEMVVTTAQEMLSVLEMGNALRQTGATGMNKHSSRSHAIVTLKLVKCWHNNTSKSIRSSKLCLVDLAGSERAGKTGNTGTQLKESVFINTGLLALGKVIRTLADPGRNRSAYIPYRGAKITRLLRDALGGTAHTVMMACVSPSDDSLTETMSVLQFASKARHIRNCPKTVSTHTEVKFCNEARLGELEHEVQTLREQLKEERKIAMGRQRTEGRPGEGDRFKQPSQMISDPYMDVIPEEPSQCCLLAQEAAVLLSDISDPSHSLRQRLQDWQERLTAVNHLHQAGDQEGPDGDVDQHHHDAVLNLSDELKDCKQVLARNEQLLGQMDAELRQVQQDREKVVQKNETLLQALQEEKELNSILIDSSPSAFILRRIKKRSHLQQAEIEEQLYCQLVNQTLESSEWNQEKEAEEVDVEEDIFENEIESGRSLNRTWTIQQSEDKIKKEETSHGNPLVQPTQEEFEKGTKENQARQSQKRKAKMRVGFIQKRIRDLSFNMRIKEELIKELNKTDLKTQAAVRHGGPNFDGREAGVFERLSLQSQQVQADVQNSLQHMRQQSAQLQSSLAENIDTSDDSEQSDQSCAQMAGHVFGCKHEDQECSGEKLHTVNWLEEEEERVLQRRAKLQELEKELKRREEVLLHRESCLQQKINLEVKMQSSSQALSQDLLRVSGQLDSLEEKLQRSRSGRHTEGLSIEELEEERDLLKQRRDSLDAQLKENRLLTVEEEHVMLQLEEAIEALDAALEFKNLSIQDKQEKLLITDSSSCPLQSTEPTQFCDMFKKLRGLSKPEASELLVKYFNKVIYLREAEHHLRLYCEELQLQVGEQQAMLREHEAAMQCLALDADRRLTQQHRDYQNNIQLLLKKLHEGGSGETQQVMHDRMQHLEKELFYYKSISRQLRKKLEESFSDTALSVDEPSHTQSLTEAQNILTHTSSNKPYTENIQTNLTMAPANTKQTDRMRHSNSHMKKHSHQSPCPSSSSDIQTHKTTEVTEYHQINPNSKEKSERMSARSGEGLAMTPVRLHRRELRQISPADLQACGSTQRRHQSFMDTSTELILEDSIEIPRNISN